MNDIVNPDENVSSYTPIDLAVTWDMTDLLKIGALEDLTLGVEARNIFDTDPPYVNSIPNANGGGGYDATVTSPIGRQFAVSLRTRF